MKLLSISQVARRYGRSESGIRRLADAGRLPIAATLADGSRLFHEKDVDDRESELARRSIEAATVHV